MRLLGQQGKPAPSLPGIPYKSEIAKVGDIIYVIHLKKEGKIIDLISPKSKKIEISVGPIRTKVDIKNLRFIAHAKVIKELVQKNKKKKQTEKTKIDSNRQTFQTSTNTISVRGMRSDEALDAMWKFIDSALLRSEICVYVIHGHGDSNILKDNIRKDLRANPNMSFAFKAAEQKEGGDGVTIVFLT